MSTRPHGAVTSAFLRLSRQVWVRAALFALLAVLFALLAGVIGRAFPFDLTIDLGQNSVGSILQIIATSMLTATTFSVTAMVTAYSSASTSATPRATRLLVADPTSQNALATFVGAFVFALVGIIALSTGYYGDEGRTILFVGTLVVVAIIVVTLLRWIAHLAQFGRMADVIDRVEDAACETVTAFASSPALGAQPYETVPAGARLVWADQTGYVGFVDLAPIERAAASADAQVYLGATPGTSADALHPLAYLVGGQDDDGLEGAVRRAVRVEHHRDFEQDPRLGVIALSEIASRALSPATNDPGTAIDVIAALQRVFAVTAEQAPSGDESAEDRAAENVSFPHVHVRPPQIDDLVTDAFRPIARDGAGIVEVQIRLQKCLAALAAGDPQRRAVYAEASADALRRSREALDDADMAELARAAATAWDGPTPLP